VANFRLVNAKKPFHLIGAPLFLALDGLVRFGPCSGEYELIISNHSKIWRFHSGIFVVLCVNGTGKAILDLLFLLSKIATLRTLKMRLSHHFVGSH
jgi:hypothetical protein